MPETKDAAVRKRQQISQSSRTMFIWVSVASMVVGFALVISWFLLQQIIFKNKVIDAKNLTVSTLQADNSAMPNLTNNIRVLDTDSSLNSVKTNTNEQALQVILDALPADYNPLALGASIQQKLVGGVPKVSLESLDTTPQGNSGAVSTTTTGSSDRQSIGFSMTVSSSDPNALANVLKRFESSIRTIDIDNLSIEKTDSKVTMTIVAHAYYLPQRIIELTNKVVKP